ncbi:lipopolysaccharide biosynthesis protein [Streptomyces cyaneochromogenes]|uniref:Lipopolysaccharide biosynthesis protein n=2 Tax=Streptomyces cyaneochromogenes TaxID=2496836 RepID=A0A3Q9EZ03_9ACTN|nr:lipopolysaccharide biosynthesis protein [Streptomyces cyaneochromogenes]
MTFARSTSRPATPVRIAGMRRDPLVLSSFYLMLTMILGAAAGFLFWILVARLYPAADVGRASALLSCVALLSYFSLFGLSTTLVRTLPTSDRPGEETSTAVSSVSACTLVISGVFVILIPWTAPQLSFIHDSPWRLAAFVLLAGAAAVNLLTDSVFIALRATRINLLINGVLMSAVKVALPFALLAAGPFGIFLASGIASAVAATASVTMIRRSLRIHLRPFFSWGVLRDTLAYSLTNYAATTLNLVRQIVLPLVVLERLGPVPAATFFIAFQIANLLNSAAYAIGEALFAEGSQEGAHLRSLARRSAGIMLAVIAPTAAFVVLFAGPILRLFGDEYARNGTSTLIVFVLSSLATAFYTWTNFLLKVTCQLTATIASEVVAVGVMLSIALLNLDNGLIWAAVAWGLGNLASGSFAAMALTWSKRRHTTAQRHHPPGNWEVRL